MTPLFIPSIVKHSGVRVFLFRPRNAFVFEQDGVKPVRKLCWLTHAYRVRDVDVKHMAMIYKEVFYILPKGT